MKRIEREELIYSFVDSIVSESNAETLKKYSGIFQDLSFMTDDDLDQLRDFITDTIFKIPF